MHERPWLPPAALVGAQLALGSSWALLGALAGRGLLGLSLPALAWVHLVALGWLTLTALAILFHVIPGFLDRVVSFEGFARGMLWLYMAGVILLVCGFWSQQGIWIAWGGVLVVGGLIGTGGPMAVTVVTYALDSGRRRAASSATPLALALSCVLVALAAAAGVGLAMAGAFARWWSGAPLALAGVHAHLAAGAWLTLLSMGVSMRTLVRITGVRRTQPILHLLGSTGFLVGIVVLTVGLASSAFVASLIGATLCALGLLAYVADAGLLVFRSRDPHVAARAFLGSSLVYLVVTVVLGLLVLVGHPQLAPAYAYVALMGWLGQLVTGHLHHIGVRFLLTRVRGEDDETEPVQVLWAPLSWATWTLGQVAVVLGGVGLALGNSPSVAMAAACGLLGWLAQNANIGSAIRTARRLAPV